MDQINQHVMSQEIAGNSSVNKQFHASYGPGFSNNNLMTLANNMTIDGGD
jgi:hypothetical protein